LKSCKKTYWNSWNPEQQEEMKYEPAMPAPSYGSY